LSNKSGKNVVHRINQNCGWVKQKKPLISEKLFGARTERSRSVQAERLPSTALRTGFSSLSSGDKLQPQKKLLGLRSFLTMYRRRDSTALDPKSSVSTNSTTPAFRQASLLCWKNTEQRTCLQSP